MTIPAEMLQYFDLLVLDIADYVEPLTALQWMSSLDRLAFDGQSVFRRRIEFFQQIPGYLPSVHLAVVYSLAFLLRSSVAVLRQVIRQPKDGPRWLNNGLNDIRAQVKDFEFLHALDQLCQPEIIGGNVDHLFPLQCLTCIRLLITIFDATTILEGICCPIAAHTGKIVISHYRSLWKMYPDTAPVLEASNISYSDLLVCDGLSLPSNEVPERKSKIVLVKLIRVCGWLTAVLRSMECEQLSNNLQSFWTSRSLEDMSLVLDSICN